MKPSFFISALFALLIAHTNLLFSQELKDTTLVNESKYAYPLNEDLIKKQRGHFIESRFDYEAIDKKKYRAITTYDPALNLDSLFITLNKIKHVIRYRVTRVGDFGKPNYRDEEIKIFYTRNYVFLGTNYSLLGIEIPLEDLKKNKFMGVNNDYTNPSKLDNSVMNYFYRFPEIKEKMEIYAVKQKTIEKNKYNAMLKFISIPFVALAVATLVSRQFTNKPEYILGSGLGSFFLSASYIGWLNHKQALKDKAITDTVQEDIVRIYNENIAKMTGKKAPVLKLPDTNEEKNTKKKKK